MQPEIQPQLPPLPEQMPMAPMVGPENVPSLPSIEARPAMPQEAYEQRADTAMGMAASQPMAMPAPQQMAPQPVQQQQPVVGVVAPLVAADDDLIEKEWVDKAKEIISQTGDDPYTRTAKVGELQRSYLEKRYGKKIGADT